MKQAIEPHCLEVLGEWAESLAVGAVEVVSSAFRHCDDSSFSQDAKMLRYCAECDVNIGGNIACGSFFFPDELKDLLAAWFGDYGEGIVHGYILVYTKMMRKSSRRTAWPNKSRPGRKTFDASK